VNFVLKFLTQSSQRAQENSEAKRLRRHGAETRAILMSVVQTLKQRNTNATKNHRQGTARIPHDKKIAKTN
jgi:hypothetical protein